MQIFLFVSHYVCGGWADANYFSFITLTKSHDWYIQRRSEIEST